MERDEITADMMPVLDQFAREYNRVLELELDDLGNTYVVSIICDRRRPKRSKPKTILSFFNMLIK